MSLDFIYSILDKNHPPSEFTVDIVQKPEIDDLLFLRVYADELNSKSRVVVEELCDWLNLVLKQLNHPLTTTKVTWEVSPDDPPNRH